MVQPFIGANGQQQQVRLGVTQSGRYGLFTGGYLAISLTPAEYARVVDDREALAALAYTWGLALYPEA